MYSRQAGGHGSVVSTQCITTLHQPLHRACQWHLRIRVLPDLGHGVNYCRYIQGLCHIHCIVYLAVEKDSQNLEPANRASGRLAPFDLDILMIPTHCCPSSLDRVQCSGRLISHEAAAALASAEGCWRHCMLALQYILHIIHMYTHWQLALHSSHMSVKRKAGCMVLCRLQMLTLLLAAVGMFGHIQ